ncbi:MAG: FAD-dependent oxidoreductase [Hyphomicrobiaceae bacterium]
MRVAVLGAGIIGVTTAWQLLKDGHDVTIIERNDDAAAFTSFANAGLIAPAHAYAWASPAAPGMMWRSMINADQAIRFKPRPDPRQWSWVMSFLKECTAERARINTLNKARLCIYSQQVLGEVAAETRIAYDRNTGGLMYWYRSPASFRTASAKADILRSVGLAIEEMTPEAVAGRDPGLVAARAQIAGGLFAPPTKAATACCSPAASWRPAVSAAQPS